MEKLTIYDAKGNTLITTPPNAGCIQRFELMREDSITLRFSLGEPLHFGIGCSCEHGGETYVIASVQNPEYNTSTGAYDYELAFRHDYWLWNNKIFKFTPEYGGREASWTWCADLASLMDVYLRNLRAHGYTYKGKEYSVSIDSTVTTAAKIVTFSGTGLIDALFSSGMICDTWECECWIAAGVIHLGKCQDNIKEPVSFKVGENVEKISRSESNGIHATRIYVFGGTKNIPARYRKSLIFNADQADGNSMSDTFRVLQPSYFPSESITYNDVTLPSFNIRGETYTAVSEGEISRENSTGADIPSGLYTFDLSPLAVEGYTDVLFFPTDVMTCGIFLQYNLKEELSDGTLSIQSHSVKIAAGTANFTLHTAVFSFKDITVALRNGAENPVIVFKFTTPNNPDIKKGVKYTVSGNIGVTRKDEFPEIAVDVTFISGSNNGQTHSCVVNPGHEESGRSTIQLPSGVTAAKGDTFTIDNIYTGKVPISYFTSDIYEEMTVNGVVQNRLMIPIDIHTATVSGTGNYIDAEENLTDAEIVEAVVTNDEIFPRFTSKDDDGNTVNGRPCSNTGKRQDDIENEDTGDIETVTYWAFQDEGFDFSTDYMLDGEELNVTFQSGSLNGLTFKVDFVTDGTKSPYKYGQGQWFEIVRSDDYGRYLPDDVLFPEAGDRYVLTGWDSSFIKDTNLVGLAEDELKEWGMKHIENLKADPSTYTCDMMSDDAYGKNPVTGKLDENYSYEKSLSIGDRVRLYSDAYFKQGYRISRIIGFERNLDIPYDTPQYIIGEKASYSSLKELSDKIDELTLKGQTYAGTGGSSGIYVIRTNDSTPPTDKNVYSALMSLQMFLNKTRPDTANGVITFLKGILFGNGAYGITGDGVATLRNLFTEFLQSGDIRTEYLTVTKAAHFFKLVIDELRSVGGQIIVTAANCAIDKVEPVYGIGGETQTGWRCWWRAKDADGKARDNQWAVGDQAIVWTGNLADGETLGASNRYWWRLVTRLGTDTAEIGGEEHLCHYIDVSMDDADTDSVPPQAGDEVSQLGNRTDADRQGAIIIAAYNTPDTGLLSPSIAQYTGIDGYDLSKARRTWFAANGNQITGDLRFITDDGEEKDVKSQFDFTADGIISAVTSVRYDLTETDSCLANASFVSGMDKWETGGTVLFSLADSLLFAGSLLSWASGTEDNEASVVTDGWRRALYMSNAWLMQRRANYRRIPEYETPNGVLLRKPEPAYLAFLYRSPGGGHLTVTFEGADKTGFEAFDMLTVDEDLPASEEYRLFRHEGVWNGTGDFRLSFTGEIYLCTVVLGTDSGDALAYRYRTLFEQSDKMIKIAAENFDDDGTVKKESEIGVMADRVEVLSNSFDDDGNLTNTAGLVTTTDAEGSDFGTLFAESVSANGVVTETTLAGLVASAVTEDGEVKNALIGAFVEKETDAEGNEVMKSNVLVKADNIRLEGVVTANGYFKILEDGSIVAVKGFFGGLLMKTKTVITKDNYQDFLRDDTDEFGYNFDMEKLTPYIVVESLPEGEELGLLMPGIRPEVSTYTEEYKERVRGMVGNTVLIYNKSEGISISGDTAELKSFLDGNFGAQASFALGQGMFASMECKAAAVEYNGEMTETVWWTFSTGKYE